MIKENGRIINVSNQVAAVTLYDMYVTLQEKYTSSTLTIEELRQLGEDFISAIQSNTPEDLGYHLERYKTPYGIPKAILNTLTQIEACDGSSERNLLIVSVTLGLCLTDMNRHLLIEHSPEMGADSIWYAVNKLKNGCFYRDSQQLSLISEPMSISQR